MRLLVCWSCILLLGCATVTDTAPHCQDDAPPTMPMATYSFSNEPIPKLQSIDSYLPGIWCAGADASAPALYLRVIPFNSAGEYLLEITEDHVQGVLQMRGSIVRAGNQTYLIANRLDFDQTKIQFNVLKVSYPDNLTLHLAWMSTDAVPGAVASSLDSLATYLATNGVDDSAFPPQGIMKLTWLTGPRFDGAPDRTGHARN